MKRHRQAARGFSILAAVVSLMGLGVMGVAATTLMSTHQASRVLDYERETAGALAQAGLEYALMQIMNGGDPNVTMSLGQGTFTAEAIQASHLVRGIGTVGEATQEYRITDNYLGGDCLSVNNALATLTGPQKSKLQGITLVKGCLSTITIDQFVITWGPTDATERVTRITVPTPNSVLYSDAVGTVSGVTIEATNYSISQQITQIHQIDFTTSMDCKNFSLTVVLTDGSSATMPQTLLGTGQC